MGWKLNKLIWLCLACAPICLSGQEPDYPKFPEAAKQSQSSDAGEHPLDQQAYESRPTDGKGLNMKALEERTRRLDYSEKEIRPEEDRTPENKPAPRRSISLPSGQGFKTAMFVVAFVLLLAAVVFLIMKSGGFRRSVTEESLAGLAEWQEAWDLDTTSVDEALQDAVEAGNYRMAIRLLYLRNLRMIMDKRLVKPSPEKTNRQYAMEMAKSGLDQLFNRTTTVYETVWYGEATPDRAAYGRLAPEFHGMYERVRGQ